MTERIVAAALLIGGVVHSIERPARHHTVMYAIDALDPRHWTDHGLGRETQGFLTSEGRFVDRAEAAGIAILAGQADPDEVARRGGLLYSEEVW